MIANDAAVSVRTIETLRGPAGRLEALLNPGSRPSPPPVAVLLCHPHPLFGGTMHNKVVYHAMRSFVSLGLPVLRFNFRGVNLSEGTHDGGIGEQDDVRAALDWLDAEFHLPMIAAGFSFGANMALRVGAEDSRVTGLVSLGTPIQAAERSYSWDFLANCGKPKLFISGSDDPFGPFAAVEEALRPLPEPKQIAWITNADHFFAGRLPLMQQTLRAWLEAHYVPLEDPAGRVGEEAGE
jgi:uncharacterized protein